MKFLSTLIIITLVLVTGNAFANEWHHINIKQDSYNLRVSYTKTRSTPTYGTPVNGWLKTGELYIDIYSSQPFKADRVKVSHSITTLIEENPHHAWAKIKHFNLLVIGEKAKIEVDVDGKILSFEIKIN